MNNDETNVVPAITGQILFHIEDDIDHARKLAYMSMIDSYISVGTKLLDDDMLGEILTIKGCVTYFIEESVDEETGEAQHPYWLTLLKLEAKDKHVNHVVIRTSAK